MNEKLKEIAKQHSAVFVGPVRNCAPFLKEVLHNIERIGSLFKSYSCVFVESDSTDNSFDLLKEYALSHENVYVMSLGNLEEQVKSRTCRIGIARNQAIKFCEDNKLLDSHDFYIQMCVDDVNAQEIDLDGILSCFKYDMNVWDAMTANQENYYYDIWTIRHPDWVPFDCWHEVNNRPRFMTRDQAVQIFVISRQLKLDKSLGIIEVDAAHGGLSIYKSSIVKGCRYGGIHPNKREEESDIMQFCRDVRAKNGKIFINTEMINMVIQ